MVAPIIRVRMEMVNIPLRPKGSTPNHHGIIAAAHTLARSAFLIESAVVRTESGSVLFIVSLNSVPDIGRTIC
jgi:hypothetical protein